MEKYSIRTIRDGHYVKVIDNKIVGKASKGEAWVFFFQKERADIDPGVIELSIALAALFGIIVAQPIELIVRSIAALCFWASYLSAAMLYGTYVLHRLPNTMDIYLNRRNRSIGDFWSWLIIYYPKIWFDLTFKRRGRLKISEWDINTELGYLTLLAAIAIGGGIIGIFLLLSLFPTNLFPTNLG